MKSQNINFGQKLSKSIINRNFIIVFLLILQIILLGIIFFMLAKYIHYIYIFNFLITLITVVYIVNRQESPEFKIVWIAFMCLLPIFGICYYLFIELNPKLKRIDKDVQKIIADTAYLLDDDGAMLEKIEYNAPKYAGIINFLQKQRPYPVYDQTDVEYYKDGGIAFEAIKTALKKAKKFIFLEDRKSVV